MQAERYMSCADTAKLLRKALKAEFPGVKFSVRSSTYAGGASITARWTDGPAQGDVQSVCDLYSGATFDGMIDLKSYHESILVDDDGTPRVVHFGADFIFAERKYSQQWLDVIARRIQRLGGKPCDLSAGGERGWGNGWNQGFPVCTFGEHNDLSKYDGTEYGSTIVHRYCSKRARVSA